MLKKRLGIEGIEKDWPDDYISNFYKIPTTLIIPEGVEKIGIGAFQGYDDLRKVIIPESVGEIRYGAFYHCLGAEIIFKKPIREIAIGDYAFNCCKLSEMVEEYAEEEVRN